METARDLACAQLWQRLWSARSRVQAGPPAARSSCSTSSPNAISAAPTSSATRRCTRGSAAPRPRGAPRRRCPGRESASAVRKAIGELASNSVQIGAIVQTITGIAEQTNLLAIEAARAGERGKGCTVAASGSAPSGDRAAVTTDASARRPAPVTRTPAPTKRPAGIDGNSAVPWVDPLDSGEGQEPNFRGVTRALASEHRMCSDTGSSARNLANADLLASAGSSLHQLARVCFALEAPGRFAHRQTQTGASHLRR